MLFAHTSTPSFIWCLANLSPARIKASPHSHAFRDLADGTPSSAQFAVSGGLPQQPLQFNSPDLGPFKTATQPSDMTTRQGRRHRDTDLLARSLHIAS